MQLMKKRKIHFNFKCKTNFSNQVIKFYESDKNDEIVTKKPNKTIHLRTCLTTKMKQ